MKTLTLTFLMLSVVALNNFEVYAVKIEMLPDHPIDIVPVSGVQHNIDDGARAAAASVPNSAKVPFNGAAATGSTGTTAAATAHVAGGAAVSGADNAAARGTSVGTTAVDVAGDAAVNGADDAAARGISAGTTAVDVAGGAAVSGADDAAKVASRFGTKSKIALAAAAIIGGGYLLGRAASSDEASNDRSTVFKTSVKTDDEERMKILRDGLLLQLNKEIQ